ncbi:hypothetical protein Dtox_3673 [Desulfofarcimen acetoxidans DSM 771]|uniref:IrrE N-terminal-like domain-containing protein n=1 Tax=Desulfofarcimen acetoxidans (strain ATCC 49208 / DSM 771 / KCTC 5769 / VKM B-1644 / 5575) TaxID=485916 RepID=C8VWL8_DESAS|nr:ImmA/IrrE family metallo-endopeptidase [Desulfofarcimen acetoxidans]ACV64382.1 hypothetical protein Dtox_3673 [Desulfofarcimen acetoxidans DSM 771]
MDSLIYTALKKLAKKRGIRAKEVLFPDNLKDDFRGLYYDDSGVKLILINQEDNLEERIFTLAHELGHYALHREFLTCARWTCSYQEDEGHWKTVEDEADSFARRLIFFIKKGLPMNNNPAAA